MERLREEIERLRVEWCAAFGEMKRYFYSEIFDAFSITYDPTTWYGSRNPALIYPLEREMRFSTPNECVKFDYYQSFSSKLGIISHNFAYLADIYEFYNGDLRMFLVEQSRFITTIQRANLRIAHFVPDALVEVTAQGLRSFMRLKGLISEASDENAESFLSSGGAIEHEGANAQKEMRRGIGADKKSKKSKKSEAGEDMSAMSDEAVERDSDGARRILSSEYEEVLVLLETLGLMGMPRRDDVIAFFEELNEHSPEFVSVFLKTQNFSYAGIVTPPWLNEDSRFGIRRRTSLIHAGGIIARMLERRMRREDAMSALENFTVYLEDFKPEEVVDMRWINLEIAMERVERSLRVYEHKASRRSSFHCYEDFSNALRRIYEREERALSYFR